ncbi:hypothetical protein Rumeso_00602 [Rubellimicrobium mesophilum DSM 19309]|uniref:Uncharacterized protein n=1 Tax=Rubellimicrobium mesophilum DSM 19309 TaxID=442562 RepID=A0A017HU63_9RHOB|nr:hypothetical protein [Rubellimicrobium mesophilum]EYD77875.1 hypothetical protein Rumeso_00602 [Rubellimicrobium mesophilum DSM 19309]
MTAAILHASTRPLPNRIIDARVWLTLARAGTVVFAAGLATLLLLHRWDEAKIAAAFFAPLAALMVARHGLPSLLVAVIVGCFLISGAGWAWDWYGLFWWFDVVLHFVNPLVMMAGSMFMLWKADLLAHAPRKGRFVLWSTAIGFALGVGWEVIEWTYLPFEWPDTILDVVMDTAGAALGGSFAIWLIEQRGLAPAGHRHEHLLRLGAWARHRVPRPVPAPIRAAPPRR